jgi:parallel beta-helix repeat protein
MTIGLVVMAGSVQADPIFINTCPVVISSPGRYLLGADLTCGGGGGITINSSDVTLAFEGHRITAGVGAGAAILVNFPFLSLLQNVHILGPGLITNGGGNTFSTGVALSFVANSEVSGITVLGSGNGIVAADCTALTVTANTLGRNVIGMILINSGGNTISENDVSGNGTGISVDNDTTGGSVGTVSNNVLNGNTGVGLAIGTSTGATIQNNVTNGNGQYGIFVDITFVSAVAVSNNTSLANGMFDLFSASPVCKGQVWSANTFFTANQSCIH